MRDDNCVSLLTPFTPRVTGVLRDIEQQEMVWSIPDYPTDHSYGRVPGEKDIRLWSVPASTGLFLFSLIQAKKPGLILELGTSAAYSAIWMGAAAASYGGKLHTVEICPEKVKMAKDNIERAGLQNVIHVIYADAVEVTSSWSSDRTIDFLFMDADKENYLTYLNQLFHRLANDAVLCADNAGDYRWLMQDFICAARKLASRETITLNMDNGLFLMSPRLK